MQINTINWLTIQAPEFGGLSTREKVAVVDFALIWSFFEARCLGNNANMDKIRQYVQSLPEEITNILELQELVEYFRLRYIDGNQFSHRYNHLHLDRSGNPEEVTRMLQGETEENPEALIGCLGIIFRYRCNLFHGEKWAYELQEQQENFERSAILLRWLMEHDI